MCVITGPLMLFPRSDLLRVEAKMLGPAVFQKGKCLQCLQGGAGEGGPFGVAGKRQQMSRGVHNRNGAKVLVFQRAAAAQFDQGGVLHGAIVKQVCATAPPLHGADGAC